MKTRPEAPTDPVRVDINTEYMDSMMRFVNHSCHPVAEFREVSNGRRTTVNVATADSIRPGQEVTIDYGDDLWFGCRCNEDRCRHRYIQGHEDP
jgi:SET domain-containing protein